MAWDDLIKTADHVKAKTCIYDNISLDQGCPKSKQPLKIKDLSQNIQLAQKSGMAFQDQGKINF